MTVYARPPAPCEAPVRLLFALLIGCMPVGQYAEHVDSRFAHEVTLAAVDRGIAYLTFELERDGLITATDARAHLERARLRIHAVHPPLMLLPPLTESAKHVRGYTYDRQIWLEYAGGCMSETALLHELTHALLCEALEDCDGGHQQTAWWGVLHRVEREWEHFHCQ